ncbi:phosphate signaling complex protein PhoU [Rheinheimera maricola]|uniref:Phosphate-specific transport system accessory protein PhoU n=1 Tax=Rheinheimera maricola TaxID=2793282 RepID=A0ABS7X7F2_9GAMM|nr:phosphate signaling complex protein PhoU [Rheinheimera maricola]MBZ9611467.1 phosphate signaling complex protein PhoU [Rheinheimera maricola]
MPNDKIGGHYSQAYDDELQLAVARLLQMAALAQQQLRDAMTAFTAADLALAQQVKQSDRQVNSFEVDIDEHCLDILARRQPAATDLRLVLAILKSVNDVERIGDMAKRIAKALLRELPDSRPSPAQLNTLNQMGQDVLQMFERAIAAFEQMDAKAALSVLRDEKAIDSSYDSILQSSLASMMQDVQQIAVSLQVSQVAKSLERVGDHSRNICEQAIFLSKGSHVAHLSDAELQQIVDRKRD